MKTGSLAIALIILTLCLRATALAKSFEDWLTEGNQAYQLRHYDQALSAYEEASVSEPESAHIYFNMGTAFYMKGEYAQAQKMFEQAALKSKDPALEARSTYNLGNGAFRESERLRDSDLQKSLQALETSVGHYQKALKLDPTLQDAAHNIEVARLMIKHLLDEIQKQQEQMKEQQEKNSAEEMKKALEAMEENQAGNQSQEQENQQQEEGQQGEKPQPGEQQQQGEEQQDQQAPAENQANPEQQQAEQQQALPRDEDAHNILNEERDNREQRQVQISGRGRPVDKDW